MHSRTSEGLKSWNGLQTNWVLQWNGESCELLAFSSFSWKLTPNTIFHENIKDYKITKITVESPTTK